MVVAQDGVCYGDHVDIYCCSVVYITLHSSFHDTVYTALSIIRVVVKCHNTLLKLSLATC